MIGWSDRHPRRRDTLGAVVEVHFTPSEARAISRTVALMRECLSPLGRRGIQPTPLEIGHAKVVHAMERAGVAHELLDVDLEGVA